MRLSSKPGPAKSKAGREVDKQHRRTIREKASDNAAQRVEPIGLAAESYKDMTEPIAEIAKRIQESVRSIAIPRMDTSTLKQIQESLMAATNLSARTVVDPMIVSKRILESLARSAQAALPSYYPLPELEVIGRSYPELKASHATQLKSKLAKCVPGKLSWKDHQNICREILSYTLVPPLLDPSEETTTADRSQRRDLIFHIPYDVKGFWAHIQMNYKSLALIVDCKNYAGLLPENQITITAKYLNEKGLGLFGIILCRRGLSESAKRTQERLWEDGKMLLALDDHDLENMLSLKEAGEDPSKVIDNAMRTFRQSV
jgi:hypothetical protein